MLGPRNGNHVAAAPQKPRQRDLGRSGVVGRGDLPHHGNQPEVVVQVLLLEARVSAAPVGGFQVIGAVDPPAQEAASDGAVGDESDTQLAQHRQELLLHPPLPERELGLDRAHRMHRVGPAHDPRSHLGEADVAHLSLRHQLGQRAHRLLDRHRGVEPVLVVEIDVVRSQPLQRSLDRLAHLRRTAVQGDHLAMRAEPPGELGGDGDALARHLLEQQPQELLVLERPVHLGRVPEVDPQLQRAAQHADRVGVVGVPVGVGHPHTPQPQGGNLEPLPPQLAFVHGNSPYG